MLTIKLMLGLQRSLLAAGLLATGYCALVLVDTWWFQQHEERRLESLLRDVQATSTPTVAAIGSDGLIGRIEIPRLDISVVVVEGTDRRALRRAAGHIGGTSLPGQPGNVGISAHRDTFFRPLRNIQRGDLVTVTTLRGAYRYRVVSTQVVNPEDISVLKPDGNEVLTLVTCYPFYFVGPAPSRFVVRAERVA
jgi:sortase A